jgi:hypothetical protein
MDWLESHDARLDIEIKWWISIDDERRRSVIVGRKKGVSLRFIFSLQQHESISRDARFIQYWT